MWVLFMCVSIGFLIEYYGGCGLEEERGVACVKSMLCPSFLVYWQSLVEEFMNVSGVIVLSSMSYVSCQLRMMNFSTEEFLCSFCDVIFHHLELYRFVESRHVCISVRVS